MALRCEFRRAIALFSTFAPRLAFVCRVRRGAVQDSERGGEWIGLILFCWGASSSR